MNIFDVSIIEVVNQYSQQSVIFDQMVGFLTGNRLVKGGALMLFFWWGWFTTHGDQEKVRIGLVSTLIGCFIAMTVARALALLLPFRLRPLQEESLNFVLPHGVTPGALESFSSFPSDHATLFFALAAGMFFISKAAGLLAVLYTAVFIALPRIYVGLHYPSDILVGAIIGVAIIMICSAPFFVAKVSRPIFTLSATKPGLFYAGLFLITYQIADMFMSIRAFVWFFKDVLLNPAIV